MPSVGVGRVVFAVAYLGHEGKVFAVGIDGSGDWVDAGCAESASQSLLLVLGDMAFPEKNDLVLQKQVVDALDGVFAEIVKIDAFYDGPEGGAVGRGSDSG